MNGEGRGRLEIFVVLGHTSSFYVRTATVRKVARAQRRNLNEQRADRGKYVRAKESFYAVAQEDPTTQIRLRAIICTSWLEVQVLVAKHL